jgi:hypothetical protein
MSGFKGSDESEWKVGAAERRDERAARVEPRERKKAAKKDTRTWCKGVEGREHKHAVSTYAEAKGAHWGADWLVLYCTECGRELQSYCPRWDKEKPAWAC